MINLYRLVIQEGQCVISVPQAYLTQVFIPLPYLYALVCPGFGFAEAVTLSVTALLSALSMWANVTSPNHPTVFTSYPIPYIFHFLSLIRFLLFLSNRVFFFYQPCIVPLTAHYWLLNSPMQIYLTLFPPNERMRFIKSSNSFICFIKKSFSNFKQNNIYRLIISPHLNY